MKALLRATALAGLAVLAHGSAARAQTVAAEAALHACSTAGVVGLSNQLVDTQLCLTPGVFERVTPHANVTLTETQIHPLMLATARTALWTAAGSLDLHVTSMFRTLADQYVLYHSGACALAATPGNSNHETGRAVDLANWSAALHAMESAGCTHTYPGTDDVHFDCPGADHRAESIRAFQHLWNVNNPSDPLAEDGSYGPLTEGRLAGSPARGFARDGCPVTPPDAGMVPDAGAHPDAVAHPDVTPSPDVSPPVDALAADVSIRTDVGPAPVDGGTVLDDVTPATDAPTTDVPTTDAPITDAPDPRTDSEAAVPADGALPVGGTPPAGCQCAVGVPVCINTWAGALAWALAVGVLRRRRRARPVPGSRSVDHGPSTATHSTSSDVA